MNRKQKTALFAAGFALAGFFAAVLVFACAKPGAWMKRRKISGKPVLYVTAYSSFLSLTGPGRFLKDKFESRCSCKIQYAKAADSAGLLQRAALPVKQDLIIGLDQLSLEEADLSLFEKTPLSQPENLLPEMQNLPYPCPPLNYAPIGWIVRGNRGPKSFPDLLREEKISFPDPRTSSLGLLLLYWLNNSFRGDEEALKNFLQKLKPKVYGGSLPSWSLSYGFFQRGRVRVSLSYLSSLAYHAIEEGQSKAADRISADDAQQAAPQYQFAVFKGGVPRQTEFACVLKKSRQKKSARQFVNFLLSREAQDIIMRRNYMFPATQNVRKGVFAELPLPPPLNESWLEESRLDESRTDKDLSARRGGPVKTAAESSDGAAPDKAAPPLAESAAGGEALKTQKGFQRFVKRKKALLKLWQEAMD